MQFEALVILLQETHCTDAEKLVLPSYRLSGSSLSRKRDIATFIHEQLRYTLLDQSPPTSEIEWLCVDFDGYKIVNVNKPLPTRLQFLDLPGFSQPCLYDFNCRHDNWGYDDNSPDGECLAGWASINYLALLYNTKDAASFSLAYFQKVAYRIDVSLKSFPCHNINFRLLHHQGLLWQCQAYLLSDETFASQTELLQCFNQ